MKDTSPRDWTPGPHRPPPVGEPAWTRVQRLAGQVEWRVRRAQASQARARELLSRASSLLKGPSWR